MGNSKISLFLFGLLITLAVLTAAENSEKNSLSEEVASSRLARSADAGAGKKKKKSSRKKNKKSSRKNKKKSRKAAKKAAKKAKKSKKNKSNKRQKQRMTGRAVDGTCLESATTAMNRWRGVVANFNK